jgi:DNA modification methylase
MSTAPVPPAKGTRSARGGRPRRATATARFGSGRRESHDATAFYERFVAPEVSDDEEVARTEGVDVIHRADARRMDAVATGSVALVVTSPPYFAGKAYEEALGEDGVPGSYFEYLTLLAEVFAECKRVLEPGGRIAVNVANLGRRPYRSLAGDVTEILQDLGLLLRGEVVWWKGRAAGGSCAWGTFQRPANPVLRDVTERVVIASKGRFDRALRPEQRLRKGLPSTTTISRDEFLEATTDLWELPPESATRVGHPAPFPVELPQRFIELYTYEGDLVLDPFMGAGSTAVAALRTGRHWVGYDTDAGYVTRAEERIAAETERLATAGSDGGTAPRVRVPAVRTADEGDDPVAGAVREGRQVRDVAGVVLEACGFTDLRAEVKVPRLGVELSWVGTDRTGREWAFDVTGAFTAGRSGLRRAEVLWKTLGRAAVLHEADPDRPLVLLTTEAPVRAGGGQAALAALCGPGRPVTDVVELLDPAGHDRLRTWAAQGLPQG